AAYGGHTCAIAVGGSVYCWGFNHFGQLGDGTTVDGVNPVPVTLPGPAQAVAASLTHTCAIVDGDVYCWGDNDDGQIGLGFTGVAVLQPTQVDLPATVVAVT